MAQELDRRGTWPDRAHLGLDLESAEPLAVVLAKWRERLAPLEDPLARAIGPGDPLFGRGAEEYARWLAWLLRGAGEAAIVLPLLGIRGGAAVRLCTGVAAEAAQLREAPRWVLLRFRARAFLGVEVLDGGYPVAGAEPEIWKKATRQKLAVWRVTVGEGGLLPWADIARSLRQSLPWLMRTRGINVASMAAHFVACVEQDWLRLSPVEVAAGQEGRATTAYLEGALEWAGL